MDLTKIMTISGKAGLFKLIAQTKNGAIVESLLDMKRFPVFTHEKMSTLEEISVYTYEEDIPLKDVFKKIIGKENGNACLDPKSEGSVLRKYFEEILPGFDQERVYTSDIKKMLTWYNLLQEKNLLTLTEEDAPQAEDQAPENTQNTEDEQSNP
ncbi:MAG: DUF5606 domain-containing protein [Bacteroidales bacterium]